MCVCVRVSTHKYIRLMFAHENTYILYKIMSILTYNMHITYTKHYIKILPFFFFVTALDFYCNDWDYLKSLYIYSCPRTQVIGPR